MAKNLTYWQARTLARLGKGVRREPWRRWYVHSAFSGIALELLPATGLFGETVRTARSISVASDEPDEIPDDANFTFAAADFNARDWTDETWDIAFPAPVVSPADQPAPVTPARPATSGGTETGGTDDASGTSGSESRRGTPATPELIVYTAAEPAHPGAPSRELPFNPPTLSRPAVRVRFQTDLVPAGAGCLIPSQYDSDECHVIMTVSIAGGPPGVYGLHVQLGAESKPAESGFSGYTQDFSFTVPVNPSATLTPNVICHAPGGDVTVALPLFTFPPRCPAFMGVTFAHFDGEFWVDVEGVGLLDGQEITLAGAYVFGDRGEFFRYNFDAAQLAALTYTFNGGTPIAHADFPAFLYLQPVGGGDPAQPELPEGPNVLVLTTDYFTATVNFSVSA